MKNSQHNPGDVAVQSNPGIPEGDSATGMAKVPANRKKTWLAKLGTKTIILILKIYHKFILGRDRWRTVKRNGLQYRVQYEYLSKQVIFHGIAEAERLNLFIELARQLDPEVHIDLGAHVGMHLLPVVAAELAREYYAIEGSKDTFAALQQNIKLNGFAGKVKAFNKVLSDEEKEVVFCYRKNNISGSAGIEGSITPRYLAGMDTKEAVNTIPLDNFIDLRGRRISLKVDVEGHELAVLQGAGQLLANNQILLQIEIWDHKAAHLNWLFANGFYLIAAVGDDYYLRNFGGNDLGMQLK